MFPSCRKNAVIKKLLRQIANADPNPGGGGDARREAAAAKRCIRRLPVDELEALLRAVEQRGRSETSASCPRGGQCVLVAASQPSLISATSRLFRWPDLGDDEELRRLPMCRGGGGDDESRRCCNPFHWSRVGESSAPVEIGVLADATLSKIFMTLFAMVSPIDVNEKT